MFFFISRPFSCIINYSNIWRGVKLVGAWFSISCLSILLSLGSVRGSGQGWLYKRWSCSRFSSPTVAWTTWMTFCSLQLKLSRCSAWSWTFVSLILLVSESSFFLILYFMLEFLVDFIKDKNYNMFISI